MAWSSKPDAGHGSSGVLFPNTHSAFLVAVPLREPGD